MPTQTLPRERWHLFLCKIKKLKSTKRRKKKEAYTTHRELSVLLVEALLQGGPIYISRAWYQLSHTTVCSLLSPVGSSSCLMSWTHTGTKEVSELPGHVFIAGSNCHGCILTPVLNCKKKDSGHRLHQ